MPDATNALGGSVLRAINTQFRFAAGVSDTARDAADAITGRQTTDVGDYIQDPDRFGPTSGADLNADSFGVAAGGLFGVVGLLVLVYTLGQLFSFQFVIGDEA